MKVECIISDLSFPLDVRCKTCIDVINGDFKVSPKSYATCYLTYRHILDKYEIDKSFLFDNLDKQFKEKYPTVSETVRWQSSILIARIYLGGVSDPWWWNFGTCEKLKHNSFAIINFLRLISLSVAHNINSDDFINIAYDYAITLYRYFYSVVKFDNIPQFAEMKLAENQIKILHSLRQYTSTTAGARISFNAIADLEKAEPFHSTFKRTLKI